MPPTKLHHWDKIRRLFVHSLKTSIQYNLNRTHFSLSEKKIHKINHSVPDKFQTGDHKGLLVVRRAAIKLGRLRKSVTNVTIIDGLLKL